MQDKCMIALLLVAMHVFVLSNNLNPLAVKSLYSNYDKNNTKVVPFITSCIGTT